MKDGNDDQHSQRHLTLWISLPVLCETWLQMAAQKLAQLWELRPGRQRQARWRAGATVSRGEPTGEVTRSTVGGRAMSIGWQADAIAGAAQRVDRKVNTYS